jgi:hypothetical protein
MMPRGAAETEGGKEKEMVGTGGKKLFSSLLISAS